MTGKVFEKMDKDKKGHLTKDQYLRMTSKLHTEEAMTKLFEALDPSKSGKITREAMEKAHIFFFTDTEDEQHALNLLRGPLVD